MSRLGGYERQMHKRNAAEGGAGGSWLTHQDDHGSQNTRLGLRASRGSDCMVVAEGLGFRLGAYL